MESIITNVDLKKKFNKKEVSESVMAELDIIRQESKNLKDFIARVFKTPGFGHFKGDSSFLGFLELTWDYAHVGEGLQSDVKKYIKSNKKELDALADDDNWDAINKMLISDFEFEENSKKAEELLQTFNFIF
jgi:hypothetical protein